MAISVTSGPRVLLAACVLLAAISASHQQKRAIDCRRFVFAPICRGVAAKRSDPTLGRLFHALQHQKRLLAENESDFLQPATVSPDVRDLAAPAPQLLNNEQELDARRDSAYRFYMPRLAPPRSEYEY
ncbi:uncharacterized protein LOC132203449 [Neocloeon triangulifer]|uniref:uncharacterized protein LOC132203449 n=1 Tax=Neocloeon triangulifer TaxID=2078957 RepID=UPI00286F6091|nr:uncharacterized protein LOC132203449 [Neocloeon triangulifer]